jgi:IS1 family transposase
LETFNYRSLSIFGNFWSDLKFFKISVCNDKWTSFEHEWDVETHFSTS